MKNILLLLLVGISLSAFSQKKIKFNKDIFPLLESKDFATATPLLLDFVKSNPNNTKANYWAGAIFYGRVAAFDKQLSTGELLLTQSSIDAIDSSILFLSTCKKWLSAATLNLFNAKYYPDFTGNTTEELLADGINDLGRWINLLDGYKTDWKKYKLYSKEEITELREKELAQKYNGKYFNSVDQTLIIYNQDDQDFDFQLSWGVNDEWGCFFTASGTAKFTSGTEAYYGIDAEWPEIKFFFGEGFDVSVEGGLDFMGDDCASFGDSGSDKYTSFKKLKYGNVSIDQVNEFVASFYNSLELTDEENQRHYETGEVQFNINNFNQLINSDSKFSTKRVDQLTGTYHDRCHISLVQTKKVEINAPIITVITNVKYGMSEMGNFFNNEQLILVHTSGKLKLLKWEDINLEKMDKAPYDHMQDFSEKDFYQALGSINK